jgi:hypothetical protein
LLLAGFSCPEARKKYLKISKMNNLVNVKINKKNQNYIKNTHILIAFSRNPIAKK